MTEMATLVGFIFLQSVALIISVLIVVSLLLYADRKIWAAVQMRRGPNVVGPWGVLQSFADLIKFALKEVIIPDGANKGVFVIAPMVMAILSLAAWAVIPLNAGWAIADINVGILIARRLWRDHGRLGVQFEIPISRGAALGGANGVI
jgi:NADH-quinone oxidoreductase subunit H